MPTDLQTAVHLACVFEATARKPGNAHRFADLPNLRYLDLLMSAAAIAPVLAFAPSQPVGATILRAVSATRGVVGTNTNLGIILLLAPLAAVSPERDLRSGLRGVLAGLTVDDAQNAFEAIRLANPGGLGQVANADVATEPAIDLRVAMALAADRDRIAQQYVTDFADVFVGAQWFARPNGTLEAAIVELHLDFISRFPDSLITRKRGLATAEALRQLVLDGDRKAVDAWFAVDPPGRNPGTTADLVTASLFVALRTGIIAVPLDRPWSDATS